MSQPRLNSLSRDFWAKIDEQVELLAGIISRLPQGHLEWAPPMPETAAPAPKCLGQVLGHLLQCLAGVLAVLHAAHPERLAGLMELRRLPVNHLCTESEALERIDQYRQHIREGFEIFEDGDFSRRLPTVFVQEGESLLTLLLGNFEHIVNHKHEIFVYAKRLGVPLVSRDLYRFRTELAGKRPAAAAAARES
jgi:hypothetical protein